MSKLEERIKNWAILELNQTKQNFGSENDIKDIRIKNALKKMGSKSGGNGTARPDANLMLQNNIPVLIEYKWGIEQQVSKNKNGLDNSTKSVQNYADNGAIYYAKKVISLNNDFNEALAIGVAGELGKETSNTVNVNVYYVYSEKDTMQPKFIGTYHNFNFLNISNSTTFIKEARLTEKDRATALKLSLDTLKKSAKILNKLMNNRSISVEQRVVYTSGMLLSMQDINDVTGLKPEDLKGRQNKNESDGHTIYMKIKTYLEEKNIPQNKIEMMLSAFAVINNDTDRSKINSETGVTINKEVFDFIYENVFKLIDQNSALDILGELYSEFLKYAMGDGKENGIVLTPPYVTRLMNKIIETDSDSYVLDLATGSAGFLVSAMEEMIRSAKDKYVGDELQYKIKEIKQQHMLGIELDMKMYTLATTNMILRGDGATNIIKGSAFDWDGQYEYDKHAGTFPANKLLLNPPFSYQENGMPFLESGLNRLSIGGKAAIIIQDSAGSGKATKTISEVLKSNQLIASIKMPDDLFQPNAGVPTSIYILEHTGKEHDYLKTVQFIDFRNDGFKRTSRGTKEIDMPHERYEDVLKLLKYGKNITSSLKANWNLDEQYIEDVIQKDNNKDWNFSAHQIFDTVPTEEDFIKTVGDYLSWEVSQLLGESFNEK